MMRTPMATEALPASTVMRSPSFTPSLAARLGATRTQGTPEARVSGTGSARGPGAAGGGVGAIGTGAGERQLPVRALQASPAGALLDRIQAEREEGPHVPAGE